VDHAKAALRQAQDVRDALLVVEGNLETTRRQVAALEPVTGSALVDTLLRARCNTAICFHNGGEKYWLGIEPLLELPIGKSFSLGSGALSDYVNSHDLRIDLAAGLRVWFFRDLFSLSIYLSKPLSDTSVRIPGSAFTYPSSNLRRPYPGFAIGFLYDTAWLAFDRDELRNGGAADGSIDPTYERNALIATSWTLTLALQPVNAFRTAIGIGTGKKP
jgi:hypothetical protein